MTKSNEDKGEKGYRFREVRVHYNEHHNKLIYQKDMAKICHTSPSVISRIESNSGKADLTEDIVRGYAETFGVTAEYLLNRSPAKKKENTDIGKQLGLTDEAIETLKFLKEASGDDMNPISVVNAFLNNKELSFNFFNHLFTLIVGEFHHEQTKEFHEEWQHVSGSRRLEQSYLGTIQDFVRDVVVPGLKDSIKKACAVNDQLLEIQNSPDYHESD